ncbi:MAG TPA: SRPBCC family protein [Anaeromyxobacteraceae bacterium]|nr:SRPBCC family protein [Anaeromyxobacteraceae bacterium]
MSIEISKTVVVEADPARVWGFLIDPASVARCMPGAAITEKLDDKSYAGTMTVKVGPVSSSYRGKVVFESLDEASHTARIVASGQDVRGKGGADLKLTSSLKELGPGRTEVTAVSEVNITGILAQMGRGMVEDVSDQMFQIFAQRLRGELETVKAAAPEAAASTSPPPSSPAGAAEPAPPPAARPAEALDLGSLGAKVAGRAATRLLTRPVPLWVPLVLALVVLYLLLR